MKFWLQPIFAKNRDGIFEFQLYDIKGDKKKTDWYGSRRTIRQYQIFMSSKKEELIEAKPLHDLHIKMRKTFLTFDEKWWYAIFREIERREKTEYK
jgi:hypothetical protein